MNIREDEVRTVLSIDGPVRLGDVAGLLELARRAQRRGRPVELELGAAEHMHCAAWQVLHSLVRTLRAAGQELRVGALSDSAARSIRLLGLPGWPAANGGSA